jgi:hypothetical protein
MEPKVKPSDAHRSQITSKLGHLGTVWRQLHANLGQQRHNMGNIAANEASAIAKKIGKYEWKRAFWSAMSLVLKPCGPPLGPKLLSNGSKMGPRCAILEPSWAAVKAKIWVGLKLGPRWPKVTHSGADVAPCGVEIVHLDDFGPICTIYKLRQYRALFGGVLGSKIFLLVEIVQNQSDRSIHSHPSLLNYHGRISEWTGCCLLFQHFLWNLSLKPRLHDGCAVVLSPGLRGYCLRGVACC